MLVEPDFASRLSGFTLLFVTIRFTLAQEMSFAAMAGIVRELWHHAYAIGKRYVKLALAEIDLSDVTSITIYSTSEKRNSSYLTLVADAELRKLVFVIGNEDAAAVEQFTSSLRLHCAEPVRISR